MMASVLGVIAQSVILYAIAIACLFTMVRDRLGQHRMDALGQIEVRAALTRRLVDVAQDMVIVNDDCGEG